MLRPLTLLVLLVLAACGGGPEEPYPPELIANFLKSCEVNATKRACACAIDTIQRKFTLEQFHAFEERMGKGDVPAEMMNAIADCPAR